VLGNLNKSALQVEGDVGGAAHGKGAKGLKFKCREQNKQMLKIVQLFHVER
jgi:hypothetical protein